MPDPVNVPALVGAVKGLVLIKVDNVELMRIWNELMLREQTLVAARLQRDMTLPLPGKPPTGV